MSTEGSVPITREQRAGRNRACRPLEGEGSRAALCADRLDLHFPKVDKAERSEFKQVREALLEEGKGSAVKKAARGKWRRSSRVLRPLF
jgi:hypothetical protein